MKYLIFFSGILFLFAACSPKPKPIEYGVDKCDFCRMTIVDAQHGAEVVTTKGKVYKFDAIECMVRYVGEKGENTFSSFWVNDLTTTAGELVDATSCTYLISQNVPSPMGAFLSGFAEKETAKEWQQEKSGELFDWAGLLMKMND